MTQTPVTTTGYTKNTSQNYLLDSAALFTNVTFDKATNKFVGDPLGATNGGVTISIEQTYRDIEVDGTSHMKVKGNKVLESADATATGQLKEVTAEIVRQALNGTSTAATAEEAPDGFTKVVSKRYLQSDDYLSNIAFIGKISGSAEFIVAILDNPIVTSGLKMETEDKNEAVIEQTYEAHATVDQLLNDEFPWRIYFPKTGTDDLNHETTPEAPTTGGGAE